MTSRRPRHLAAVTVHRVPIPPDATGRQVLVATLDAMRTELRDLDRRIPSPTHPAYAERRYLLAHRIRSFDASLAELAENDDDLMALADTVATSRRRLAVVAPFGAAVPAPDARPLHVVEGTR